MTANQPRPVFRPRVDTNVLLVPGRFAVRECLSLRLQDAGWGAWKGGWKARLLGPNYSVMVRDGDESWGSR
jgi:hypothetical protein